MAAAAEPARVQRDNLASRNILEKSGMRLERDQTGDDELWYRSQAQI